MTRTADRLTGRAAPAAPPAFATRAFGMSAADAQAVAAAAAAARVNGSTLADGTPVGGRVTGATGASGSGTNLTTSTYSAPSTSGGSVIGSERL